MEKLKQYILHNGSNSPVLKAQINNTIIDRTHIKIYDLFWRDSELHDLFHSLIAKRRHHTLCVTLSVVGRYLLAYAILQFHFGERESS
jgi:hypothetical protein